MTTWKSSLENVGVDFVARVGGKCRHVALFHTGMPEDGGREIVWMGIFDGAEWDDLMALFRDNLEVFRRNLAEALRG